MPQRLSPLEVSILDSEMPETPAQHGSVILLEPTADFDHQALQALVAERIAYVPRYRQRVMHVPGRLAAPVWADDVRFDLDYHVRRAVLPRPGTWAQLEDFVARVLARPLDPSRALWELYLVDGLEDGRLAVVSKSHLALVDNVDTVDLAQVLLDPTAQPVPTDFADGWLPLPEPAGFDLLSAAVWESAQDSAVATENLRGAVVAALGLGVRLGADLAGGGPAAGAQLLQQLGGEPQRTSTPVTGAVSEHRRWTSARLPLTEVTTIAEEHHVSSDDVVLAAAAGALRTWLLSRGELVGTGQTLVALAPVSVTESEGALTALGSEVAARLITLPIGVEDARDRLRQVAASTAEFNTTDAGARDPLGALELAEIPGFAPATLHALGVRSAAEGVRAPFDLVVTNAPGPQVPLFLGPVPVAAAYPVIPLRDRQRLSVAVTSYQGEIYWGVLADRLAIDDLTALTQGLTDALADLRC